MAKYEVLKQLKDVKTKKPIKVGTIIERTVSVVTKFEKEHGTSYLKRIEEDKE